MFHMQSVLDFHHPGIQRELGRADVLLFQRNVIFEQVWEIMDYWRALGKVILVDLDDHYPGIPASNPACSFWIHNINEIEPTPIERLQIGLEHADALIAPNEVILKDWEGVVDGYYWPNYPSLQDYESIVHRQLYEADVQFFYEPNDEGKKELKFKQDTQTAGKIIIGWGGSLSHIDSFFYANVMEGMRRLMEEDERVMFKFCGNEDRLQFMLDKLPEDRVLRQRGVPANDWPKVLATFDIGIAPLDMRPVPSETEADVQGYSYDERRSWLKLVEYICAGVPFVATKAQPYKELARFGKVVENTADAWYGALKSRVDGIRHFRQEAMKNRTYALKKYTMEANAQRLIWLYTKIGEQSQAKRGLRLPNTTFIKGDEPPLEEPVERPPDRLWEGDPLETGQAPWAGDVQQIARTWHEALGQDYGDVNLGELLEYIMLQQVAFYQLENEKQEEPSQ